MNIKHFDNIEYKIMKLIKTTMGFILIGLFIYVISLLALAQNSSQEQLYEDQSEFNPDTFNYTVEYNTNTANQDNTNTNQQQQQQQDHYMTNPIQECDILHDGLNIKIIDMMLFTNTINTYCMVQIDDLLNTYTIEGTLKDRYLILEHKVNK